MARDLAISDDNLMVLKDAIGGGEVGLFYRTPLTEDFVKYQKSMFKREGKKLISCVEDNRLKYGLKLLTGVQKGDFTMNGKVFSTNPADPDYRPDWKDLIKATAGDLVMAMAQQILEPKVQLPAADFTLETEGDTAAAGDDIEEAKEDEVPLASPTSSGV